METKQEFSADEIEAVRVMKKGDEIVVCIMLKYPSPGGVMAHTLEFSRAEALGLTDGLLEVLGIKAE